MKKVKETTNGKLNSNGNLKNGKPKLNKPISKMTVDELAENFTANELIKMALERRKRNAAKGIIIE